MPGTQDSSLSINQQHKDCYRIYNQKIFEDSPTAIDNQLDKILMDIYSLTPKSGSMKDQTPPKIVSPDPTTVKHS